MLVLGLSHSTAEKLIQSKYPLSADNAEKLIRDLERTYADVPKLIADLHAYVREERNNPKRWRDRQEARGKRGG